MAKLFASGNLADVTGDASIILGDDKHTGAVGILLTGNFGAAGIIALRAGITANPNSHRFWIFNPATGTRIGVSFTTVGLYYVEAFLGAIGLHLTGGEDGVTDIDYFIFLKARP